MSGITGILNLDGAPVDRGLLTAMTKFMTFRGPDAQRIWIEGNVGFGHTLLRTTAESEHEQQPFTLDGRVWIVADARVDAQEDLIAKLAARGELLRIEVEGQTIELAPDALLIETTAAEGFACAEDAGYLVGLDTKLTEELVREGLIREIVRTVQDARKQAGLDVSDRIVLNIDGNELVIAAISAHREYIVSEALVGGWQELSSPPAFSIEHRLGAAHWAIRLARDSSKDA